MTDPDAITAAVAACPHRVPARDCLSYCRAGFGLVTSETCVRCRYDDRDVRAVPEAADADEVAEIIGCPSSSLAGRPCKPVWRCADTGQPTTLDSCLACVRG
jgi:hypothetical protein